MAQFYRIMRSVLVVLTECVFSLSGLYAQSVDRAEIYGTVREYGDNGIKQYLRPTPGATVQLTTNNDTLFTTTNNEGIFLFKNLLPQEVQLKLFLLGKKTIEGTFEIDAGQNAFYFIMEDSAERIDSAKITAEAELSRKIADTTIYNVRLLNTIEGESARALLEQLPGFKVDDNKITIDGKEVKRTYVNGVQIFGDHPVTAIDALKAEEVVLINVYDELSPEDKHRGLIHGNKQRVLDITTLKKLVALTDAVLLAEGGSDDGKQARYQGMGAAAFWSEMTSISALASYDNLSSPLQEVDRYAQSSPLELARKAQIHAQPLNNYSESTLAKVDFAKYWKDRSYGNSVKGAYSFGKNTIKTASTALKQYYQAGDSPEMSYFDTTTSANVLTRHLFDVSANLHDTPLKSISISTSGSIDTRSESSIDIERIISNDIRLRRESAHGKQQNYDITARVGWTDNDHEKLRPSVDLETQFNNEHIVSWKIDTLTTSYNRRNLSSEGDGKGLSLTATARLSYMVFNNEKHSLSINGQYRFNYRDITRRQMTIDSLDIMNPIISTGSSFDYSWKNINHYVSLDGYYSKRDLTISGGLTLMDAAIRGADTFPKIMPTNKHYFSALPFAAIKYGNLFFKITTMAETPALEQIRNYISDANPMVLLAGNPLLRESYILAEQFQWALPLNRHNGRFLFSIEGVCSFNPVVTKSKYFNTETTLPDYFDYKAPAGSILYSYANAQAPAWTVNSATTYSGVFCNRKLVTQFGLSVSFKGTPQFVGEEIIGFKDTRLSLSAALRYTPSKKIKINLSPAFTYLNSSNGLNQTLAEGVNISAPLSVNYNYLKHGFIVVNNRFGYNHYISGLGKDITTDFLSATVGWRFFNNALTVSLSANDVLNASIQYVTSATAQYFSQTWTPSSGRYYLLSVLFEFRKKQ